MLIFVKLGCITFVVRVILSSLSKTSLNLLVLISRKSPFSNSLMLIGEELYEAAMAKKSTAAGLGGWAWNEIKKSFLSLGLYVLL